MGRKFQVTGKIGLPSPAISKDLPDPGFSQTLR